MSIAAFDEAAGNHPLGSGEVPGHRIMKRYSGADVTVYQNLTDPSEISIAYRGSDFLNPHTVLGDIKSDIAIAFGLEGFDSKFINAKSLYNRVAKENSGSRIHLTGHSLGGGEAAYVARATGAQADVFNPGIGIDAPFRSLFGEENPNIHIRRVPFDPISIGGEFPSEGDETWYWPGNANVHGISGIRAGREIAHPSTTRALRKKAFNAGLEWVVSSIL